MILAAGLIISCKSNHGELTDIESKTVKDNVTRLMANVAKDISAKGPAAWLDYFEHPPNFFIASRGQMAFDSHQSAREYILNTLVKNVPHIKLQWHKVRIDPLSTDIAAVGRDFQEELTYTSYKTQYFDGYFTGTAHQHELEIAECTLVN